jgi:hypothetical protein
MRPRDWSKVQQRSQESRVSSLTLDLVKGDVDTIKVNAEELGMCVESYVLSKLDLNNTKLHYPEFTRHYGQTYVSHTL